MNPDLIHDAAMAVACSILECIAPCLREEEQRDAFEEIYARVRAGIEAYEQMTERPRRRLRPSRN
jgi:hypothetical protein